MRRSFLTVAFAAAASLAAAENWPTFRGPEASGIADGQNLPATWDVKTGTNLRWKTALPGTAHSSPVVWGDRVFLTTVVTDQAPDFVLGDKGGITVVEEPVTHTWRVLAIAAGDGRVLWDKQVRAGVPRSKRHTKASQSNATPATDGKTVVAILGSEGLFAFDTDGTLKWNADLGVLNPGLYKDTKSEWGHASSPILFENLAIVQVDRHQDSFLAAFDLTTGERAWTVARDERPVWATPTLVKTGARTELVVVGGNFTRGYDPRTGRELWRFKDEAEVKTPTPFVGEGLIVMSGGYRGRPMFALKPGGTGDLSVADDAKTGPFLAWRTEAGGPYTTTPLAYGGLLFGVRDEGIAFAYDMRTGERVWRERTGTTHSASLVASDGKLFAAGEDGQVLVLRAGPAFELLARNDMGESCMATPAIANGVLFVRTRGHLYAIAEPKTRQPAPGESSTEAR